MAHFCGELQREVDDQASHLEGKPQLILQRNGGNVTAAKLKQNQGWVKKQYPMTRKEQLGSNLQREFSSIKLPLRLREGWGWNGFRSFFPPLSSVFPPIGCLFNNWPQAKNGGWGVYPPMFGQLPQLHPCEDLCQHFEEGILFPPQSHGVLSIWTPPGEASHSHLVS